MIEHPFSKSLFRESAAKIEFDQFLRNADACIETETRTLPRFAALKAVYSFYVERTAPNHLQLWFGNRARVGPDGKLESERGPALVYSQGAGGAVAVMLYPAAADSARVHES